MRGDEQDGTASLPAGGRLVANAATVESEAVLAGWFARVGRDLTRIEVQRAEPVGSFTGLEAGDAGDDLVRGEAVVTVYFIRAGPGAADLITVRAARRAGARLRSARQRPAADRVGQAGPRAAMSFADGGGPTVVDQPGGPTWTSC